MALDEEILDLALRLRSRLNTLEQIQRCGVGWQSSREVRCTVYALSDLIRKYTDEE